MSDARGSRLRSWAARPHGDTGYTGAARWFAVAYGNVTITIKYLLALSIKYSVVMPLVVVTVGLYRCGLKWEARMMSKPTRAVVVWLIKVARQWSE